MTKFPVRILIIDRNEVGVAGILLSVQLVGELSSTIMRRLTRALPKSFELVCSALSFWRLLQAA